jgi:hypothetical protein
MIDYNPHSGARGRLAHSGARGRLGGDVVGDSVGGAVGNSLIFDLSIWESAHRDAPIVAL